MEILISFLLFAAGLAILAVIVLCYASIFVGVLYGASRLIRRIGTRAT